jgi:hypothetical protein
MKIKDKNSLKKSVIFRTLVLFATFYMAGCSKAANNCSSPDNINDAACQKQLPSVSTVPVTLGITYADSQFYDQNSLTWDTLTKANLTGGTTGITVPIYSDFLDTDQATALTSAAAATAEFNAQSSYAVSAYNEIPYIEIVPETGVQYLYDYVKKDLNNTVIYEQSGTVPTINGRVILPLINAMFNGNFYSTNAALGSLFVHSLTFAAQSATQRGTISSTINFETSFNIPPTDYTTDYSTADVANFSLDNRWQSYFNTTDYNPNTSFKFFTLKQNKTVSEQIPLDLKIVFQTPPVLNIDQDVFFELPFDYDTFKANNTINPSRGSRFYDKTSTLTSATDFGMNMKINGVVIPLTNTKELEYLNLPANTPWNIDFSYDFTQNAGFAINPANGVGLLDPLKPECWQFTNTQFNPIAEQTAKTAAIAAGGYISICHPTQDAKVTIAAGANQTLSLTDSWFNFFSYIPYNAYTNELGHFFGIKQVRFYASGCLRIYSRQPGTSSYILTSNSDDTTNQCGTDASGGWVYWTAEKVFTIFDLTNNYTNTLGLVPLIQTFSTSPTITDYPLYRFNVLDNDVHHIY